MALCREGKIESHGAQDGVVALAKYFQALVEHQPFTHILLDIAMPRIDGFTVCEWIRKLEKEVGKIPRTSIASYTAHTEQTEGAGLLRTVGFDTYFRKPGKPEQLAEMVENWLLGEVDAV